MKLNLLTEDKLLTYSHGEGLTLEGLRKFIEKTKDLPGNLPVLTERVEDKYFNEGVPVLLVEGEYYTNQRIFNEEAASDPKIDKKHIVELTDSMKEQFFQSWCITHDETKVLIYNHY